MPSHASMDLVELERLLCRELGCRFIEIRIAAPVTEFEYCRRCGKVGERL